jgi:transposase
VDKQIERLIKEDENLTRLFTVITSVNGVGTQTAVQVIIRTNEFKNISDPKKFACYSGVAPFAKESGLFKGKAKVSHMANKKVKTLLTLCALVAIGCNEDLKAYYERKVDQGKNKMSVINAVRNKLIHRIFACVNQNRRYENSYITTLA